jgi:predicted kinase
MLIAFSGLPGTGKSTLARALAQQMGAVYVRIDTIEKAVLASDGTRPVGEAGYRVGYAIAEDNLRLGRTVIADSVNPLHITRNAWRDVAKRAGHNCIDVAVICSDPVEHRHRVETRQAEFRVVTWHDVVTREFEPLDAEHIAIDTAGQNIEQSIVALQKSLHARWDAATLAQSHLA